jgi:hypothetical protein
VTYRPVQERDGKDITGLPFEPPILVHEARETPDQLNFQALGMCDDVQVALRWEFEIYRARSFLTSCAYSSCRKSCVAITAETSRWMAWEALSYMWIVQLSSCGACTLDTHLSCRFRFPKLIERSPHMSYGDWDRFRGPLGLLAHETPQ